MGEPTLNSLVLDTIKRWPFFSRLTSGVLAELEPFLKIIPYSDGKTILTEGQNNIHLFFLWQGMVEVVVDGERVAQLSKTGEVIGEMSLITNKPVSATVLAKKDVVLLGLDFTKLNSISATASAETYLTLFKYFSEALADKLAVTNSKARQFEIANRDLVAAKADLENANVVLEQKVEERTRDLSRKTQQLVESHQELEQQYAAMAASLTRLQDLNNSRDQLFLKLSSLQNQTLAPLQQSLDLLAGAESDPEKRNQITKVMLDVSDATGQIQNLNSLYNSEAAIKNKRVLFVEADKKQSMIAKMALGGTGVELDIANELEAAAKFIEEQKYDLMFVESQFADFSKIVKEKAPQTRQVLLTSDDIQSYLPALSSNPHFENLLSRNMDDRTFMVKCLSATVNKIINKDLFGIEKYLAWGVDIQKRKITDSECRPVLISEMATHFAKIGVRKTIIERCSFVAEELLMNAIYDAPVDSSGKSVYNHLPRTEKITLKPHEQGTFKFACDGILAGISVTDPFGALRKETLYEYLVSNYEGRAGELNKNKGGAGRGLFQLIASSDLVIFNLKTSKSTEVIALFNIDLAASKSVTNPTFHLFAQ